MATAVHTQQPPARLPPESEPTSPPVYRLSVEQYHRMIEAGVFHSGDRVELLEGCLVPKMTQNPPHPTALELVREALTARLPPGWVLRSQAPITTRDSEPEPDVAVVRGPTRRYRQAHPVPAGIALVIEVADTTLGEDRGRKRRIYARARLPVYWIVNLPERQVEVYTEPRAGRSPTYRRRQDFIPGDSVPLLIDGQDRGVVPVSDLLP